jgi:hypothetical protein
MCNFFSAVFTHQGGVYHVSGVNSHEDIIAYYNLKDGQNRLIARAELIPPSDTSIAEASKWTFQIDETDPPEWVKDVRESVELRMRDIVSRMIVRENMPVLPAGQWIVAEGVTVGKNYGDVVHNNGTVTTNYGTVTTNYGTVTDNNGTVTNNNGTVTNNNGTVTYNFGTVTYNFGKIGL